MISSNVVFIFIIAITCWQGGCTHQEMHVDEKWATAGASCLTLTMLQHWMFKIVG